METKEIIKKAEQLRMNGYFKESLKLWKKIYKKAVKNNDVELGLDCLIVIGDLNRILGNFKNAELYYSESIELSDILNNKIAMADALTGLALSKKAMGQWRDALKLIRQARKIYERNKDKKGIAFTFWAEGAIWRFGGRIKKSLQSFYKSLTLFKKLKNNQSLGYVYCGLGGSLRVYGNYEDSMRYYRMANQIFNKIKDRFGMAYSFCGIGNAYRMIGDYKNAEKNFKKAINIYSGIGDIVSSSYTLWSMAMINILRKKYAVALQYIKNSEKNFKKCKDPRGLIYCKLHRGIIHYLNRKKFFAIKYFSEAFNETQKYDFALEKKYAQSLLKGKYTQPYNIP
ncbi:tetratricopeptide repeat protein [Thermodesulfovibrio yellowstonii]|uniref:tetratricopeptide repeat protein n=1 Tax=Thermodesulfovibrio yellowstonii TaxID=28262 RepID=UPI00040A9E59|nr:tetratricopeptide repeat protein [Thermodesulfovibrio islandicus]